jgi:hypothetical protein
MDFNPALVSRASQALRGYSAGGRDEDRDAAHAALSDLMLTAQSAGAPVATEQLRQLRDMLSRGPEAANDADNILDALTRTR